MSPMLFSELYKIMKTKVTFVGFRGSDRPHPRGSAPAYIVYMSEVMEESQENTNIMT